jgi:hypothetical protein
MENRHKAFERELLELTDPDGNPLALMGEGKD